MEGNITTTSTINWRGRDGDVTNPIAEPDAYWEPALSNDGTRVAVSIGHDTGDIWILEIERGTRTRFTFDPADDRSPLWSPDDSQIVFESSRQGSGELYVRPSSGQGDATLLFSFDTQAVPTHWSSDGRYIIVTRLALNDDGWDIWLYDLQTQEARAVADGPFNQMTASLSNDGKWIAYNSNESGTDQVYVQAFPDPKGRWMISNRVGYEPMWRSDDREIFYLEDNGVARRVGVPGRKLLFRHTRDAFQMYAASCSTGRLRCGAGRQSDPGQRTTAGPMRARPDRA